MGDEARGRVSVVAGQELHWGVGGGDIGDDGDGGGGGVGNVVRMRGGVGGGEGARKEDEGGGGNLQALMLGLVGCGARVQSDSSWMNPGWTVAWGMGR